MKYLVLLLLLSCTPNLEQARDIVENGCILGYYETNTKILNYNIKNKTKLNSPIKLKEKMKAYCKSLRPLIKSS